MSEKPASTFYSPLSIKERFLTHAREALDQGIITLAEKAWVEACITPREDLPAQGETRGYAHHIGFRHPTTPSITFKGVCLLCAEPEDSNRYYLYSLVDGFRKFNLWAEAVADIRQRLTNADPALMYSTPFSMRHRLTQYIDTPLEKKGITSDVFESMSELFNAQIDADRFLTVTLFSQLPSARSALFKQLQAAVRTTRPSTDSLETTCAMTPLVAEHPIVNWIFEYYLKGTMVDSEIVEYRSSTTCNLQVIKSRSEIELELISMIASTARHLDAELAAELLASWTTLQLPFPTLQTTLVYELSDRFLSELLEARHSNRVSSNMFNHLFGGLYLNNGAPIQCVLLHINQTLFSPIAWEGWYGIYIGDTNGQFIVMTDRGLEFFDSWAHFVLTVLPRVKALLSPQRAYGPDGMEPFLARYMARIDRAALTLEPPLGFGHTLIHGNVFATVEERLLQKIISDVNFLSAWIKNLDFLQSSYTARDYASLVSAVLEDALDIRALVNPALIPRFNQQRWCTHFSVGQTTTVIDGELLNSLKSSVQEIKKDLQALDRQLDSFLAASPSIASFIKKRFAQHWSSTNKRPLDIENIEVYDTAPHTPSATPLTLIDSLLEHVTGHAPLPAKNARVQYQIKNEAGTPATLLDDNESAAIHRILFSMADGFSGALIDYFAETLLHEQNNLRPALPKQPKTGIKKLVDLRLENLWAGGLYFYQYEPTLSPHDASCIEMFNLGLQLDQRRSFYHFVSDVFSVTLNSSQAGISATLEECFLITERGGMDASCCGRVYFWSPAKKFEVFASLADCQAALRKRLFDDVEGEALMSTLGRAQRATVLAKRAMLLADSNGLFSFEVIQDNFLESLSRSSTQQHIQDLSAVVDQAIEINMPSAVFQDSVLNYKERIRHSFNITSLIQYTDTLLFEAALPKALKEAPLQDQLEYATLLERYRDVVKDNNDYLHDIPDINDFAYKALKTQLSADYPHAELDPHDIEVTITVTTSPAWTAQIASLGGAVSRSVQPLSAYALRGFGQLTGHLSLRSLSAKPLPPELDASAVKDLVRQLNIGTQYRTLLAEKLPRGKPDYAARFGMFCNHLPLQVLEAAFNSKLAGQLTDAAYRCIEQVMNMPDGGARESVKGQRIQLRRLQLCTSSDATPDPVKGVYVISPQAPGEGPFVVWATYNQDFSFKEYPDEQHFILDLCSRATLQSLILSRLTPYIRKKYDNGGFKEPHVTYISQDFFSFDVYSTPAPVTLSGEAIEGNAFLTLYDDNTALLLDMAKQQSVTTSEADWTSFKTLLSLIAETALMFLPGKLSLPITVWQTQDTLKSSVLAAAEGHWGEALTRFVASMMMLITVRSAPAQKPREHPVGVPLEPPVAHQPVGHASEASFLKTRQLNALQPYIDHLVSLHEMTLNEETGIYSNAANETSYIVLSGNIYKVKKDLQRWRIDIGEGRTGPALKRDSQKRWELDPREPLLGGGPILSRHASPARNFPNVVTEAEGMPQIRRLYPAKAAAIEAAHQQAIEYLIEAKRVLKRLYEPGSPFEQHRQWLEDFFGSPSLTPQQIKKIKAAIDSILGRLLKPSMNPLTSERYVVLRHVPANNAELAFILADDTRKYIYIYEGFFQTVQDPFNTGIMLGLKRTNPPFDFNLHFRATTLIHEVSHQTAKTVDIAYMNASSPYIELLENSAAPFHDILDQISSMQATALSRSTTISDLFISHTSTNTPPASLSARIQDRILAETGASTLDQARLIFLADPQSRFNVILSNADSLTLLISRLGGNIERYQPVVHP